MKSILSLLLALSLLLCAGAAFAEGEGQPFTPEKPVAVTGSDGGFYTLTYDDAYFEYSADAGVDVFAWRNQPEGDYPRCFMSVHRVNGYTLDEVIQGLVVQENIEGSAADMELNGQPMKTLRMCEGTAANSRVFEFDCLSLSDGSVLVVEMDWFVEAEEGIGARLLAMRDTLQLVIPAAATSQP